MEILSGMLGVLIVYLLIVLALAIVMIAAEWKLFTKAGRRGWACLIPIYNIYTQADFSWSHKMAVVLAWLSGASVVLSAIGSVAAEMGNPTLILTLSILILLVAVPLYILELITNYKTLVCFDLDTIWCVLGAFFYGIAVLVVGFSKDIRYFPPDVIERKKKARKMAEKKVYEAYMTTDFDAFED